MKIKPQFAAEGSYKEATFYYRPWSTFKDEHSVINKYLLAEVDLRERVRELCRLKAKK